MESKRTSKGKNVSHSHEVGFYPIDAWQDSAECDSEMTKQNLTRLSRKYATALREHLKQNSQASLSPALRLGRQAAALKLETLDVARMHAAALATLEAASSKDGIIERAELFFSEAITPIEKTHHVALKANVRLNQLNKTLGRRMVDLASSQQSLQQRIGQRKSAEQALKTSTGNYARLVKESGLLQKSLRNLTHQILSSQEAERAKISRDLHDEVAQTLLGINVQLLTLKQATAINSANLKKEIASTQRLVKQSARLIERFASEFGN